MCNLLRGSKKTSITMLGAQKKTEPTAKPGLASPQETLAMAQLDLGTQPVVMWSKVRAEKMEQLQVHEEGAVAGCLYAGPKAQ